MSKKFTEGYCSLFFSALANELRIRILQELALKKMTVNELCTKINSERTLVSHNLAILLKAELIKYKKIGNTRQYFSNEEIVPRIFLLVENLVCQNCSIKRVCATLGERNPKILKIKSRPACVGCR